MSDPTIRPIWTPDDARQAAADAAQHRALPGKTVDAGPEEPYLPFRRNVNDLCPCCAAWPLEECEPSCLSRMTPEQQEQHRNDVLDGALAELVRLEALPTYEWAEVWPGQTYLGLAIQHVRDWASRTPAA